MLTTEHIEDIADCTTVADFIRETRGPKGHCRSPEYNECEKNF